MREKKTVQISLNRIIDSLNYVKESGGLSFSGNARTSFFLSSSLLFEPTGYDRRYPCLINSATERLFLKPSRCVASRIDMYSTK